MKKVFGSILTMFMLLFILQLPVLAIANNSGSDFIRLDEKAELLREGDINNDYPTLIIDEPEEYNKKSNYYSNETGNLYLLDQNEETVVVDLDLEGDLLVSGADVLINSTVGDNLIVAGGRVQIDGDVIGDVFAFAGVLVVNGRVEGDLRALGGSIHLNNNVYGDLQVGSGEVKIAENAQIMGLEQISSFQTVRNISNPETDVNNVETNFNFYSPNTPKDNADLDAGSMFVGLMFLLLFELLLFAGFVITGYIVLRLFPVFSEDTLKTMGDKTTNSILIGLGMFLFFPILVLLLLISVIGTQVGLMFLLFAMVALYLGNIYIYYFAGRTVLKRFGKNATGRLFPLLIGVLVIRGILFLLNLVPIIGPIVGFILMTAIVTLPIGAMVVNKYNALKTK